ncbi:MAG TPA: MBL fold metallo-hydrolase, partial [Polyangiaceae bacterium]|nr:MBL fold metallo-hydrolase [Polyangiaceae bacterium]
AREATLPGGMPHLPELIRHSHGITTVDAMYVRPRYAAVHIIEREGRAAIVDTGTNASVPLVLAALEQLGIATASVEWVLLTHVHLDHAGGAGLLLEALPRARAVVHPRGVAHLVDPSRLVNATRAVYGAERFERLYGTLVPIAAERIVETHDLDRWALGADEFTILHTPGHALHHQVFFDPRASAVFTGDTFGLSYPALESEQGAFIVPTTTPTQFDPEQLLASIERLLSLGADAAYLTHFGRVTGLPALARELREQIGAFVAIARARRGAGDRQALIASDLRALWIERLARHQPGADAARVDAVLSDDLELNAQGLVAWLERDERK